MKTNSSFVPSDIKIALQNQKRAVAIRKNCERQLTAVIQEESQFFDYGVMDCERITKAVLDVIKAYSIEDSFDRQIQRLRGVKEYE